MRSREIRLARETMSRGHSQLVIVLVVVLRAPHTQLVRCAVENLTCVPATSCTVDMRTFRKRG